jgi:hypothetical protein
MRAVKDIKQKNILQDKKSEHCKQQNSICKKISVHDIKQWFLNCGTGTHHSQGFLFDDFPG